MDHSNHATELQSRLGAGSSTATGPFVVNLCASVAPIELKSTGLPGLERYRVYQVRRVEDDRPRYRLRLGFFADEASVEIVLAAVRQFYPGAFCVPACSDDLKHAPGFDASVLGRRQSEPDGKGTGTGRFQQLPQPVTNPKPAATMAPPAKATPAVPTTTVTLPRVAVPPATTPQKQTLNAVPKAPAASPNASATASANTPFRIKPADPAAFIKASTGLSLQTDMPSGIRKLTAGITALGDGPVLIDSTQTLRMLTEAELSDQDAPPWFAVQLAVSEQPINLETMPKLDIFSAFRLYSVAMTQQGKIQHSLRLGFFRESVSAEAVGGYLKTFFSAPDVLRVSAAEQTRFAAPPTPPVLRETAVKSAQVVPLHDGRNRQAPVKAPVLTDGMAQPRKSPASASVAKPPPIKQMASIQPASKPVVKKASAPAAQANAGAVARKTSQPVGKRPTVRKQSLSELLNEEARQVELSESGIRQLEAKGSLLSRLVGRLTR